MKIAMYGHKRIPSREGGVEIVVGELATRMSTKGHYVVCFNRSGHHVCGSEYNSTKQSVYKGVIIKYVLTMPQKGLSAMTSSLCAAILSSFGSYDIVHIHAEGPAATCFLPKFFGKRVIVTIHGLDWQRAKWGGVASKYIKWGEKQAVKHADEIIVLSKNMQKYFLEQYHRETVFIPNGIEKKIFIPAKIIAERWGLKKNSYILYLGRIVPEKGIIYLLKAWNGIQTDKKLVIAGGMSDTEQYMNELKRMAGNNVIFTDFQQGRILEELYSNAYVYCLPSDLEGMPISLLEAMSYGNCCLVSSIAECTEIVEDKAIIFKKGNIDDLRDKLTFLLEDENIVEQYKLQASEFICKKYDWEEVVYRTLQLYAKRNA